MVPVANSIKQATRLEYFSACGIRNLKFLVDFSYSVSAGGGLTIILKILYDMLYNLCIILTSITLFLKM